MATPAAYTSPVYQAPKYDEEKYRQNINTDYYTNAIKDYADQANKERAQQLGKAEQTRQSNLRQAYVNRLQNERKLNQNLAVQGIRGGASETAMLNLANQYGQARNAANSDYTNSVNDINRSTDQNIRDYTSDMSSRAEEYRQNLAQAQWQAEREDQNNEIARQTEYWSNYYINYYSGYSKKDAKKAVETIQKKLEQATDPMEIIRLQQQMSGVRARLGVIKNK